MDRDTVRCGRPKNRRAIARKIRELEAEINQSPPVTSGYRPKWHRQCVEWSSRHSADVQAAAYEAATKLVGVDWGESYPDEGWAMVRGAVISLAYDCWAEAHGMRGRGLAIAFPEAANEMRSAAEFFQALPLADLEPEHFGHVHETLVDFGIVEGKVLNRSGRRRLGAHFTPPPMARHVAWTTIKPLLSCMATDGSGLPVASRVLNMKICDPACGAGAFGLALVRLLAPMVKRSRGCSLEQSKRLVAINVFRGVDKDRYAVLACKLALTLECRADAMPSTWLDHAVKHGDALVGLSSEQTRAFHWKREANPDLYIHAAYDGEIDAGARRAIALQQSLSEMAVT